MSDFAMMIVIVLAAHLAMICFFAWVPGAIAKSRHHSQREAINVCGWVGAIFVWIFWFVAFVWAFTENNRPQIRRRRHAY